ncbi:hypothetical protein NE237_015867 [Protea cynaroides]|uniref:LOB domain-containing protein n=1 Tax=Protea cynaroides TaxID=273540 RepID=A0A9Q0KF36_9MAGN|nr:hypothetical protein NE237_015867 [Protea cynaroides]
MANPDEVNLFMNPSPLFPFTSTSSLPSPQLSLAPPSSQDHESPPLVVRPCGACKGFRRRCTATCILAPYFPPTQPVKFLAVHKVFGASNVSKFLQEVPEFQRADAVKAMVYEATTRIRDPVYGSVGVICNLEKLVNQLQMELATTKAQLLNIRFQQENQPVNNMTYMEMKEADLPPTLEQPLLDGHMFGTTPNTYQTWENYSLNNSFLPFDATDSGGI